MTSVCIYIYTYMSLFIFNGNLPKNKIMTSVCVYIYICTRAYLTHIFNDTILSVFYSFESDFMYRRSFISVLLSHKHV